MLISFLYHQASKLIEMRSYVPGIMTGASSVLTCCLREDIVDEVGF
jgi:hypothetical protein